MKKLSKKPSEPIPASGGRGLTQLVLTSRISDRGIRGAASFEGRSPFPHQERILVNPAFSIPAVPLGSQEGEKPSHVPNDVELMQPPMSVPEPPQAEMLNRTGRTWVEAGGHGNIN